MPTRFIIFIGFVLISFGAATQVSANWFLAIFNDIARETKRRQCWPAPFVALDRADVRSPFCTMVNNGWRRQNMLGEFYFKQGTGQLTEAGRNKVRWILTVCPEQHRLVYINIADTKEETLARRAAVEQLVAQIAPDNLPPVLTTSISEDGWSAEQADIIGRKYLESIPKPRLPQDSDQESGGESSN
ncbi:MAG: hypothetical protein KKE86_02740 [Planctomycetes bacterium]|nr:hypothetical protein [Planctomycetota bacterium]MBU4398234.1 hypothetical protein [Planctomycetota bacterium]MCG2685590.1 hypothetical protein [Planctomycetales bacterium]